MRLFAWVMVVWANAALAGPRVVLDAGHGGGQEGALSPGGFPEKTLSLRLVERLRETLEKAVGAEVLVTRSNDVEIGLAERVAIANRLKPDLFISIHANSMPTRALRQRSQGIETFFLSSSASGAEARSTAERENAESPKAGLPTGDDILAFILADLVRSEAHGDSSRLAYSVHQRLVARTGGVDRGVQQAPFYVLMGVEAPAVLLEVGFISHPEEGKRLALPRYQEQLAEAIAEGVKGFWSEQQRRDRPASP